MNTPSPLVILRCQRCRTPLGTLDTMPDDWSGKLTIERCRCVIPSPRRIVGVLRKHQARGFVLWQDVPLAQLRPAAQKAKKLGRPESVSILPITKPT